MGQGTWDACSEGVPAGGAGMPNCQTSIVADNEVSQIGGLFPSRLTMQSPYLEIPGVYEIATRNGPIIPKNKHITARWPLKIV